MLIVYLLAAAATTPTAVAIDSHSWFSPNDYPVEAMKKGIEGSVTFDVDVDSQGKPTACRITASSGSQVLDQATCDVVQRKGRFTPATGPDGKPVAGHYSDKAVWHVFSTITEPAYQATILDFTADPLHPVCTTQSKGPGIGAPTCDQLVAVMQDMGQKVTKFVSLVSGAPGSAAPYRGEPDWGTRVSYKAWDQYYVKGPTGTHPIACISVAAEGFASGKDSCAGFAGPHTITDEDKLRASHQRIETSMFAVSRTGMQELGPGLFRCEAPAGEYANHEIAALPVKKPVTIRFRLISERSDPSWLEQTAVYFETPKGQKRIQIGKADADPQHMYVALLDDKTGQSEIVDQFPVTNDWIELSLLLNDRGSIQVGSGRHRASLDLGTQSPVKTEIHCHSGTFEIQVLRPS